MVKIYRLTEVRSFNPLLSGEASYVSTFWAQHGAKQNGYPMTMVDFLKKKKNDPCPSHFVIYDLCLIPFKK